jgi:tRNA G18 (ribose-2'-O)-methylase SpoU
MIEITDINDDRISYYKSLRFTPKLHSDNNAFIAEGEKVVLKLLNSDIDVLSVFGTSDKINKYKTLIDIKKVAEENRFIADMQIMKQIVGYKVHSGFMAIGRIKADVSPENPESPCLILNGIVNSENVGAIIRNAAAFGFRTIIVDESTASPWLRRAVRVSMGAVFGMNIYHSESIKNTIINLRNQNFEIIAAEITNKSVSINSVNLNNNQFCIVFGSEGHGINQDILGLCHKIVHIPISGTVDSLNVASSSAVILSRISRIG